MIDNMTYYKLGCNWGSGKPDFYKLLKQHSIVICAEEGMKKGDFVVITQGFRVIAMAQISSNVYPCTSKQELEKEFANYDIDYEDWNNIANAEIWELSQEDRFIYQQRKGICQIQDQKILEKAKTLIHNIFNRKMIKDCRKLLQGNYNIVLTGAPGTGKTYLAKEIAKDMGAEWKLVQFHPSYDYTDFVEGLRPIKEEDKLGFQRKDGVFKAFCKNALDSINNSSFDNLYNSIVNDISNGTITTYETLSGIVYPLKVVDGVIKYGCKNNGTEYKSENVDHIKLIYNHYLNHPEDIDYSFEGLRGLISKLTIGQITTLDPSEYTWTIKELLSRRKAKYNNYVFIIDEINRGEISKIFGELFYSIDSGYRGTKGRVNTQYQNLVPDDDVFSEGFFIPENVYIIGTMNDIDRSVESMDYAMRRRFAWKEVTAESRQSMLDEDEAWGSSGKPSEEVIAEMKARMDNLNAAIIDQYQDGGEPLSNKDIVGLSKAYQIGAAYFLKYALYNDFEELWTNHLEGLLYEYLRGKTNIEEKIKRLHQAYNDTTKH